MATEIKLRRGTTAQHASFNGAEGEVTYDTDKHTLIVHNNEGNGTGRQIALLSDVQAEDTLAEMNDVNLTSPADGSVLKYDNASSKWIDSAKLTETATGIDVNGEVKGDSLDIDGNADISGNLVLGGDLNVTGTTTTVNQTNLDVSDNIIGLNRGASTNSNDSGFIIERGSTGDNAVFVWDESADKFTLGTTTATPSSTGDLSITTGTLVANVEGNLTGTIQTAAQTNITSVGDLTALNVDGTVTADGIQLDGNMETNGDITIQNGHELRFEQADGTESLSIKTSTNTTTIHEQGSGNLNIKGDAVVIKGGTNIDYNKIVIHDEGGVKILSDVNGESDSFNRIKVGNQHTGTRFYCGTDESTVRAEVVSAGLNVNGTVTATSYTGSQTLSNSVTDTDIDATEFAGYVGTKIIYTGSGTGNITLPAAVSGDAGKSWIVINTGSGALTVKRDTNTQTIKFLNGSAVSTGTSNLTLAVGSVAEIICTGADNYITFGTGIS